MTDYIGDGLGNTLSGASGDDHIQGLGGNDQLFGNEGNDLLEGGAGVDLLYAGAGHDTLFGGEDSDFLYAGPDGSELHGDAGNDVLLSGAGNDTMDGGGGLGIIGDQVSYYYATAGITASLAISGPQDTVGAGIDTFIDIGAITGSHFDDILTARQIVPDPDKYDQIEGSEGNDYLIGGPGTDAIAGDDGVDTASYETAAIGVKVDLNNQYWQETGVGNDILSSIERLIGSDYNDDLKLDPNGLYVDGAGGDDTLAGAGAGETLDGGAGLDTVSYAGSPGGVSVDLRLAGVQEIGPGAEALVSIERVIGSAENDVLIAGEASATLDGGDGDDALTGGMGDDLILGGKGIDLIHTGAGHDTVFGGGESDFLIADGPDGAELHGDDGNDNVASGQGDDTLDGGAGNDIADYGFASAGVVVSLGVVAAQDTGGAGVDTLIAIEEVDGSAFGDLLTAGEVGGGVEGAAGDDTLVSGAGGDFIAGDDGVDTASYALAKAGVTVDLGIHGWQYTGGAGTDLLTGIEHLVGSDFGDLLTLDASGTYADGAGGDDTLAGAGASETLNGGAGQDTVSYATSGVAVQVNLHLTGVQDTGLGQQALVSIERLIGSSGGDALIGGVSSSTLSGGDGDDTLTAGGWSSSLDGGQGNDVLTGSVTGDILVGGGGDDTISGGGGADQIFVGAGHSQVDGGDDLDRLSFASASSAMTVDLQAGTALSGQGDISVDFTSIESLAGSSFGDTFTVGAGAVTILAGDGDDTIVAGTGATVANGGAGFDTVDFGAAGNGVAVNLAVHASQDTGAGLITLVSIEKVIGSDFDDIFKGSALGDNIAGGGGDDLLHAKAGDDLLSGGDGADTLAGSAGADTLVGGAGADVMTGGQGGDTFVFLALSDSSPSDPDVIRDLSADDVIDLSAIDAYTAKPGDQDFTLVSAFTGHAGQAALIVDAKHHVTLLELDVDGDGQSDMTVRINGVHGDFANFVL